MKAFAKQVLFGLLALALTLSLVACGGDKPDDTTTTTTAGGDVVTTTVGGDDITTLPPDDTTTTVGGDVNATTTNTTKDSQQGNQQTNLSWAQVKANMPASLKNTTITLYNWNELSSTTDGDKIIANFTKETSIKVNWLVGSYKGYLTEIAAKQAAKDAPDIIRMKRIDPAAMVMLQPLENTGYNFDDAAWDQVLMQQYSYKGKAYATNLAGTLMQQPSVYFYNKTLINKYDLDDPYTLWKKGKWTWSKFDEICKTFKEEAGDDFFSFSPMGWTNGPLMQAGAGLVGYNGNEFVSNMTAKSTEQGMKMYIKMKAAGYCTNVAYQRVSFEQGNGLFLEDGIIGARTTHFYYKEFKSSGSLGVVPLPSIDGQKEYYQLFNELEAYAIPLGAKNKEAVPYFLRYFLDGGNFNQNTFFANKTILEVYKACMAQPNRAQMTDGVLTEETGTNLLWEKLIGATEAQIATVLGQQRAVVEAAVKQANTTLKKLG